MQTSAEGLCPPGSLAHTAALACGGVPQAACRRCLPHWLPFSSAGRHCLTSFADIGGKSCLPYSILQFHSPELLAMAWCSLSALHQHQQELSRIYVETLAAECGPGSTQQHLSGILLAQRPLCSSAEWGSLLGLLHSTSRHSSTTARQYGGALISPLALPQCEQALLRLGGHVVLVHAGHHAGGGCACGER